MYPPGQPRNLDPEFQSRALSLKEASDSQPVALTALEWHRHNAAANGATWEDDAEYAKISEHNKEGCPDCLTNAGPAKALPTDKRRIRTITPSTGATATTAKVEKICCRYRTTDGEDGCRQILRRLFARE
jgi:hypothetical protein